MRRTLRSVLVGVVSLTLAASTAGVGETAVPAGTKIVNQARATYESASGATFAAASNIISTSVAAVASVALGPQDASCTQTSDAVSANGSFTRSFTITNTSNGPDAYVIGSASVSAGSITSIVFSSGSNVSTAAAIGGAASPTVAPGGVLLAIVTINSAGVSAGTKIVVSLSVRGTQHDSNGIASASAQQCGLVIAPPLFSGVSGSTTPIVKTVNGESVIESQSGASVTYDIKFKNAGGSAATNAVLTDVVPAGITPLPASVLVNGAADSAAVTLTANTLRVALGTIAIDAVVDVSFTATVGAAEPLGSSMVNTATVSATQVPAVQSLPATVFIGSANVVYDGYAGASSPIAGALVTLSDAAGSSAVPLTGAAVLPNAKNADPFATGTDGTYSFGLAPPNVATMYTITVTAAGYIARRLAVLVVPSASGTLYTVTVKATDGAPLAVAGGFSLAAGPITLTQIYGLFGNIPMFRPSNLTVTKTVDRNTASGGDRLVYTITVANASIPLGATTVTDMLPPSVGYATGTSYVDGALQAPVVQGATLTWSFPDLKMQHEIVFSAVVLPNATDGDVLLNHVVAKAALPSASGLFVSGRAEAQTVVIGGVFSNRIPITGRVFADIAGTGTFVKPDTGVGGVRVWLEDGESAVTDAGGRYNFPAMRPGMHVVHLDRDTLPAGVAFYPTHAYNAERSSIQLVHGPFDGGLLQDVNFALKPVNAS